MDAYNLMNFANAQGSGYLKYWKANSICDTLGLVPSITEDHERLHKYIDSCLRMEGFSDGGILAVVEYIEKSS